MSSFLSNYCFYRCPARPPSRNSLIQDDNNTTDDSDIYGDLGDCSIQSEYSNSMISTLISRSSTELDNSDLYNKDENEILENIDLALSFEEMSDALTTSASSFTMASSIESGSIRTMKLNPNMQLESGKHYNDFQRLNCYEGAAPTSPSTSYQHHSKQVCDSKFNFKIFWFYSCKDISYRFIIRKSIWRMRIIISYDRDFVYRKEAP